MRISDWSSDVCSSDLTTERGIYTLRGFKRNSGIGQSGCITGQSGRNSLSFLPVVVHEAFVRDNADHELGDRPYQCVHPVGRESHFRSEEHTSELQSLMRISYAVFCLNKKNKII